MNDHNLDDLIIDTVAPKNSKTKSMLTIVALLIIVLIVAIILTKTLLISPETDELSFEENISEMIAPELKLQESSQPTSLEISKPKEEASLSTLIEEKITAPKEETKESSTPSAIAHESLEPLAIENEEAPIAPKEEKTTQKDETKPVSTPVVNDVPRPRTSISSKPKSQTQPKTTVKKAHKKPASKPTKKPEVSTALPKTSTTGRYYVQVSSFKSTNPSSRLLSVIKSSGFTSHVSPPDRTGYKKLLIGPYKTREEVDKARDIVRDRILKSAFVVER